jgi:hypothetical protein
MFARNLIAIDFSHVVAGRRLMARFQPQQWINDHAVDSDPVVLVDVTDAYLWRSPAERAAIRDNRESSDELVHESGDMWKTHDAPGYVQVEDFLEEFHAYD